jgi:hypothetical protein
MARLTFITMLAYDYRYAYNAVRSFYDIADEIILGIDADRLTWMRQPFEIDMEEMRAFIEDIDTGGKIRIVEGNYHDQATAAHNDTVERSRLSREAAPGNWIVQIDADEILVNGPEFRAWLLEKNPADCSVCAQWISIFKVFGNQALVVDPPVEPVPVATMLRGEYRAARRTEQKRVMSPLRLLHFSWGRTPQELRQKLGNWGHAQDFNVREFYRFWESVTLQNYAQARNFHPLDGPTWESLRLAMLDFVPAQPYERKRPGR